MSLRVALLTPFAFPSVRGNAVTVARIARALGRRGIALRVWDLSITPESTVAREVEQFRPLVVHAFHAYWVGPLALRLARRAEVPLIVTTTGTDVNHDLFSPERAATVRWVFEGAATIVVFHASVGETITAALPDVRPRLVVIPQAADLEARETFPLGSRWLLPANRVLFVLPAGLRPVKRPAFPLRPLDRVVTRRPDLRLLYVGPILDPEEGETLLAALPARPWARYIGAVPHAQMASLLAQADVVLNCSLSEGGMANSVLEALAVGRAVLASDIPGNRSLIANGVTGLLFADEEQFAEAADRLAADPALRRRLGDAGRSLVERQFPPSAEIDAYLEVYHRLVPVTSA